MELFIRPAQKEDHAEVSAMCQHTFTWGDYVPDVFSSWLKDDASRVVVAECQGELAGLLRLVGINQDEAWLEGMRISRPWRRQGVARQLTLYARDRLLAQGFRVIRLAINHDNAASHRLALTTGFRPSFSLLEYTIGEGYGQARPAGREDLAQLMAVVPALTGAHHSPRAMVGYDWRWSEAREATVAHLAATGKIWTNGRSWTVVDPWPAHEELTVHCPYGALEDIMDLMGGLYQHWQTPLRVSWLRWLEEGWRHLDLPWGDPEAGDVIYAYCEEG